MKSSVIREIRNRLAVASANIEGVRDGVLVPTPERLGAVAQALEAAGVLLGELLTVCELVQVGDLTIDRTAHDVVCGGRTVKLTPTEYRLLGIFVDHPGQVFARDHLIELVSHDAGDVFDRTLDRHIANLRSKIEVDVHHPAYILTVYGVGYKMAAFA